MCQAFGTEKIMPALLQDGMVVVRWFKTRTHRIPYLYAVVRCAAPAWEQSALCTQVYRY